VIDIAVRVDMLEKSETEPKTLLSKVPLLSKRRSLMHEQMFA